MIEIWESGGCLTCQEKQNNTTWKWLLPIEQRRGANRATVALANKIIRISWNILAKGEAYDSRKAFALA